MIDINSSNSQLLSPLDQVLVELDQALKVCFNTSSSRNHRPTPAQGLDEPNLEPSEQKLSSCLMRVNHSGEIAAQALYRGQSFVSQDPKLKSQMLNAADEEVDHLAWCEQRLSELNSHTSYLAPVWYLGSFAIGAAAGAAGDHWSLGFVEETELQVSRHLEEHMQRMPSQDTKSQKIISQMHHDEGQHAEWAHQSGATELPGPIKSLMKCTAKIMTKLSFYL